MTERVRHVSGPGRLNHGSLSGVSTIGDEHDLDADTASYFCDELGYFERTGDITLSEEEYEVVEAADAADDIPQDMDALTKSELYDFATEAGIEGRSTMSKDELIDALSESED